MFDLDHEAAFYPVLLGTFVAVALVTFPLLFFVSAPYGRHAREGWGPRIDATLGWVVMEAPSSLVMLLCWFLGDPARRSSPAGIVFLLLWEGHYVHRAFVFPFRRRGGKKDMPLSIAASALLFNVVNAYLNGRWLYTFGPVRGLAWLTDPRFVAGVAIFAMGAFVNQQSDRILFKLRRPGDIGYKIPFGGFYRFVSCPNYFGEIVEWTGWALLTFSPAGLAFALWTAANLVPRARTHHRWYRERFSDYPRDRRAILPYVF